MQQVALHTRLRTESIDEYERVHAVIPAELDAGLRRAGVHSWTIWRDGVDLFHLVQVEDWALMQDSLSVEPVDIDWQERIGRLLDDRDHEVAPLSLVWRLPSAPDSVTPARSAK